MASASGKKRKRSQSRTESRDGDAGRESTGIPKRDSRGRNHHGLNIAVSKRGTKSARRQGKETSEPESKLMTEIRVPMEEHNDRQNERVVFIDDITNKPAMQLFRTAEGAESTARLWADFLPAAQSARDRLGVDTVDRILSQIEASQMNQMDLNSNDPLFPTPIVNRGFSLSRDDGTAGSFPKSAAGRIGPKRELLNRAFALRTKAAAIIKQAEKDERAADRLLDDDDDNGLPQGTAKATTAMAYIGDVLPALTRKNLGTFMAALSGHVRGAEKRLHDQILFKVGADLKLCRDVRQLGRFEMQAWQMETLPSGLHKCQCPECLKARPEADARGSP